MPQTITQKATKLSYNKRQGYSKRIGQTTEGVDEDRIFKEKKFYLGHDRREAERRCLAILELWEKSNLFGTWTDNGLAVGSAIASGKKEIRVKNSPSKKIDVNKEIRQTAELNRLADEHNEFDHWYNIERYQNDALTVLPEKPYTQETEEDDDLGPTLHEALDAYRLTIENSSKRPEWKNQFLEVIDRLRKGHKNQPIKKLGFDDIQALGEYWLSLPKANTRQAKHTGYCITPSTAIANIKILRRFFRWLDATDDDRFDFWRVPRLFSDLLKYKTADLNRLYKDKTGFDPRSKKVRIFSIEELKSIWQFASPRERLYFAVALNTGGTQNELATLRQDEMFLDAADRLDEPAFIQRDREKTGIEGKFLLWDITISLLKDYLPQRNKIQKQKGKAFQTDPSLAIVTENCTPIVSLTKNGNNGDRVASSWNALHRRLEKKNIDLPAPKSFKIIRKTGAQLVREVADDETASIYLCHANTSSDKLLEVYSNRDYEKLDAALIKVRERLSPVFDQ